MNKLLAGTTIIYRDVPCSKVHDYHWRSDLNKYLNKPLTVKEHLFLGIKTEESGDEVFPDFGFEILSYAHFRLHDFVKATLNREKVAFVGKSNDCAIDAAELRTLFGVSGTFGKLEDQHGMIPLEPIDDYNEGIEYVTNLNEEINRMINEKRLHRQYLMEFVDKFNKREI